MGHNLSNTKKKNVKGKLDEDVQTKNGLVTSIGAATRRDSNIAWIQEKDLYIWIYAIQGRTGGVTIQPELMNHVLIPYNWKEFIFHRGSAYNQHSITKTGLVAGGKESKEGRQTVFFTPLDPFGRDTHEEEESSEDYSQPRKIH